MDDFAEFAAECHKWIDKFGLTEWQISIEPEDLGASNIGIRAQCCLNWTQHAVCIRWNTTHRVDALNNTGAALTPRRAALHEVLHVLLHQLVLVSADRGSSADVTDAQEHAVINRLMSVL